MLNGGGHDERKYTGRNCGVKLNSTFPIGDKGHSTLQDATQAKSTVCGASISY
jgi:hypothetical protein